MPFTPYTRRSSHNDDDDDEDMDESRSGIASESGIYTYDGQYTVASRSPVKLDSDHEAQEMVMDNSLDYGSLVSGIEDASFLMNESSIANTYKGRSPTVDVRGTPATAGGGEQYSLDVSSIDFGDYTTMRPNANNGGDKRGAVNDSMSAVLHSTPHATGEESIFSGAYTRVLKSFLFPSGAGSTTATTRNKNNDNTRNAVDAESGKATPKTLSPREDDDEDNVQMFRDDDASYENDGPQPQTVILGKAGAATPRTPKHSNMDRKKKKNKRPPMVPGSAALTVYTETKVLGLRLSRVLCIVLFILVAAVAEAVGSALANNRSNKSSNFNSNNNPEAMQFPTFSPVVIGNGATLAPTMEEEEEIADSGTDVDEDDGGEEETFTDSPTMAPTAWPIPAPTSSPVVGTSFPVAPPSTGAPLAAPTQAPISPPTGLPTVLPTATTQNPTSAPVGVCSTDDDTRTFVLFDQDRTCVWFRGTNPNFQDFFCSAEYDPFWICRATCNNCLPAPTASSTTPAPTAPTVQPTASRSIQETVLQTAPSSTLANLQQGNTPQSQALEFLMEEEELVLALPAWRIQQLFAMATLAFAANLDGGGGQRWLNTYDECLYWGVACDDAGAVAQINISGRDRGGGLPEELVMLPSLVLFDGAMNGFTGQIPIGFGFLPNLVTLRLEQNELTGNIPQSFVNAQNLRNLFLDRNELSGDFPGVVLGQMSGLGVVSIYGNNFNGNINGNVCDLQLRTFLTDCANTGCFTECVNT